ncbi:uncharacterized protein LOC144913657 [Branchiostoma floridae x Branchiostoma belcheri]
MAMSREIGQGDDQRHTFRALTERPGLFELYPIPEEVEEDQTQASTTPTPPGLKLSIDQRVSIARKLNAKLRPATEAIVAKRKNGKADADACQSHKLKRKVNEDSPSSQARRTPHRSPECPPHGAFCDPRLSNSAPIYYDVVAGERVLVNAIARDPCRPRARDPVVQCGIRNSHSPYFTDGTWSSYQRRLDRHNRKMLKQLARRLKKHQPGQPD